MTLNHTAPDSPGTPKRQYVVVLSDKISITILWITWIVLLIAWLRARRRNRRLVAHLNAIAALVHQRA